MKYSIIAIIVLSIVCVFSIRTCYSNRQALLSQTDAVQAYNDTIKHYKDYAGREHAEKESITADWKTAQALSGHLLDSVAKAVKVPKNNIKSVTTVTNIDKGQITSKVDTVYIDSNKHIAKSLKFNYSDRWLTVYGEISDSVRLNYATLDSIVLAHYTKTHGGFFNRHTDDYIDGYNINPNGYIMGLQNIHISTVKQKKWAIVAGGGYGLSPAGLNWFAGATVGVKIFEW